LGDIGFYLNLVLVLGVRLVETGLRAFWLDCWLGYAELRLRRCIDGRLGYRRRLGFISLLLALLTGLRVDVILDLSIVATLITDDTRGRSLTCTGELGSFLLATATLCLDGVCCVCELVDGVNDLRRGV